MAELPGWLVVACFAGTMVAWAGALFAARQARKIQARTAAELERTEALWRQVRGAGQLDGVERDALGRALYGQFDRGPVPWERLDHDVRELWRGEAERVAAAVTALLTVRTPVSPDRQRDG